MSFNIKLPTSVPK